MPAPLFVKGRAKTGGRKPGALAKMTAEAACRKYGINPFEYLAMVVAGQAEVRDKIQAARVLANRLQPELRAIEHSGPDNGAIPHSVRVVFGNAAKPGDANGH